jgi:hypothetical protein
MHAKPAQEKNNVYQLGDDSSVSSLQPDGTTEPQQ